MLKQVRKVPVRTAGIMTVVYYFLVISLHVLILGRIIPFSWVNGGRSQSFEAQIPISVTNIVIAVTCFVLMLIACRIIPNPWKWPRIPAWILTVYWVFGLAQKFLGTAFEKTVCAAILLLGVFSHFRIAVQRWE